MAKILVIHGPNLGLLGEREPEVYGKVRLDDINREMKELSSKMGAELKIVQSDREGEIVEVIAKEREWADVLLINPAGYTHSSVAIRDAISATGIPAVEVHLSNIYKRETFRRHSLIAEVSVGQISGFGQMSYMLGLQAAIEIAKKTA